MKDEQVSRQEQPEPSRLPLAEIALACGFSSQSHLSRLVKIRFGAAPRELRERP